MPDSQQNLRIGIFGGSFNPVHVGHIGLAKQILNLAHLDEVWFLVSPLNPFKKAATDLLDDDKRLDITRQALAGEMRLVASDYEFHLPKPSYTWNTLKHLKADFPNCQFTLIIGADNWLAFDRWAAPEYILSNCEIAVYARPECPIDPATLPSNVRLYDTSLYNISSTMIRNNIRQGLPVTGLVPSQVEDMVKEAYLAKSRETVMPQHQE